MLPSHKIVMSEKVDGPEMFDSVVAAIAVVCVVCVSFVATILDGIVSEFMETNKMISFQNYLFAITN